MATWLHVQAAAALKNASPVLERLSSGWQHLQHKCPAKKSSPSAKRETRTVRALKKRSNLHHSVHRTSLLLAVAATELESCNSWRAFRTGKTPLTSKAKVKKISNYKVQPRQDAQGEIHTENKRPRPEWLRKTRNGRSNRASARSGGLGSFCPCSRGLPEG